MQPDMQDVGRVFESLEQSQRKIADTWSDVMRNTALPTQAETTEAILRSQNEIMRIALRWMDPANGFAAMTSNWFTMPQALSAATLELQRKMLETWTTRDEIRPEAIAQRWGAPWLETMGACQEAMSRMVEFQSAWMRSFGKDVGRAADFTRSSRSAPRQGRRPTGNGRKSRGSQSQRAH
jgi:hypothetical protein